MRLSTIQTIAPISTASTLKNSVSKRKKPCLHVAGIRRRIRNSHPNCKTRKCHRIDIGQSLPDRVPLCCGSRNQKGRLNPFIAVHPVRSLTPLATCNSFQVPIYLPFDDWLFRFGDGVLDECGAKAFAPPLPQEFNESQLLFDWTHNRSPEKRLLVLGRQNDDRFDLPVELYTPTGRALGVVATVLDAYIGLVTADRV